VEVAADHGRRAAADEQATGAGPVPAVERGVPSTFTSLERLASDLLGVVDGIVHGRTRVDLAASLERLREARANLVVLGEFKRGKSTLVNALVGSEIVPTGVLPLTAVVTAVRHGPQARCLVTLEDGTQHEIAREQIADFATETANPQDARGAREITLELPAPLLAAGVQLVDTPGIGSVHAHNTATALEFLGQIDAAIVVLAADQPLAATEEALIRTAAARVPTLLFVLNMLDRLAPDERIASIDFVHGELRRILEGEPEVFPLSARTGDGVESLRRRLEAFARLEREDVLARSVRSLAASFAAEAAQAVRFEVRAVELPLAELTQKLEAFRARAEALELVREEAAGLLEQATRRLVVATVDEPLLTLAAREGPGLREAIGVYAAGEGKIGPRTLARRLDAWIGATVRERFERLAAELEAKVASGLADLHERYAERVSEIVEQLDVAAADLFGARAGLGAPEVRLRRGSRFTFKLRDAREPLDQLASLAAASAPGRLGRHLVLGQAEQRLQLMLDRHAGRLRSDLAERIRASMHVYERELTALVAEARASVEAAVERSAQEQRNGRDRVAARLAELGRVELRIAELERALFRGGEPRGVARPQGAAV
jgi:small GTP-binding protein